MTRPIITCIIAIIIILIIPPVVFAGFRETLLGVIPPGYGLEYTNPNIIFSSDGSKAAFAVSRGISARVIFGNKAGKEYYHVRDMAISPDAKSVAYNGTLEPEGDRQRQYLVINGKELGPYQQVCNPVFSPDSSMVAFDYKSEGKWRHGISRVDGHSVSAQTAAVFQNWMRPVFSPDGKQIVSIQIDDKENKNIRLLSTLEMKELRRREYDEISGVVYSGDGRRTAYRAKKSGKEFIVRSGFSGGDEAEDRLYTHVSDPVLSFDGTQIAYGAVREGVAVLVVNGREIIAPFFYERLQPVFSADWKKFAYITFKNMKQTVVHVDKKSREYEDISGLAISRDGSIVAYGALSGGKWHAVVGSKEGPAYEYVDEVQFSPDGKRIIYRGTKGRNRCLVVADLAGRVLQEVLYDEIWQPAFDEKGVLGFGAMIGNEIWWKVMTLE